jgi:hypothetical protein
MNKWIPAFLVVVIIILTGITLFNWQKSEQPKAQVLAEQVKQQDYWFILLRKSKQEFLYRGIPGDRQQSSLVKQFKVNVGVTNDRPTPLPQLMGREYWNIIAKYEVKDDPETAPYFLTLDIPFLDEYPFGPTPYTECNGEQCDWVRPGSFGLHGVAGDPGKLSDYGSSGCIRHSDEDITYLYNLLNPNKEQEIRYYIEDI